MNGSQEVAAYQRMKLEEEKQRAIPGIKHEDPVNSPNHYTWHPAGVECIRIIEVFPHNIAAAMGYLWRHDHKGEPIQDLRKAVWHIEREIKRRGGE